MIKLFRLLRSYSNYFLFLLLFLVCINLIAKQNRVQSVDIINSSNVFVGFFYKIQHDIVSYFQLRSVNKELLAENASLRNKHVLNEHTDSFQNGTAFVQVTALDTSKKVIHDVDTAHIVDSSLVTKDSSLNLAFDKEIEYTGARKIIKNAQYQFIPARVINNSISNSRMNFITINRGSSDGIKKNMAVIASNGIVGRVTNVSAHFATVLSILSEGRTYNAQLKDGTEGLFNWDMGSSNSVTISKIPKVVKTKVGDTVYTSGYSLFPEGMMMGTISSIDTAKTGSGKNIKVLLSTNFRKLKYVYVIIDKTSEERLSLEQKTAESTKEK